MTNQIAQDYAQYLAEQAESSIAVVHEFRLSWSPNSTALHLFFEGDDDPIFIMPEIRRLTSAAVCQVYVCNGKKIVREARDQIQSFGLEYFDCLFFVDRDYDDFTESQVASCDRLYITSSYSIENYVASKTFLEILIDDFVNISRSEPFYRIIIEQYEQLESEFVARIKTLCAWIIAARCDGLVVNLANIQNLNKVFEVSTAGVCRSPRGFDEFRRKVAKPSVAPALRKVVALHRSLDECASPDVWLRGKFKFWFFKEAVLFCLEDASAERQKVGGPKIMIKNSIREGRFFELAAGRLPLPADLQQFLERHLA